MNITAIFASDSQGGMGINQSLPWPRLSDDFANFRRQTTGNVVIMGSRTWTSIGSKPLANRINVVLTRQNNIAHSDWVHPVTGTPQQVVKWVSARFNPQTLFVIGGAEVLGQYWPFVQSVIHTEITGTFASDVTFNNHWQTQFTPSTTQWYENNGVKFSIKTWYRKCNNTSTS